MDNILCSAHHRPRWCLNGYFVRHELRQQIPQADYMQLWNYDRLSTGGAVVRATLAVLDAKAPSPSLLLPAPRL